MVRKHWQSRNESRDKKVHPTRSLLYSLA